jgi:hypothetical protein
MIISVALISCRSKFKTGNSEIEYSLNVEKTNIIDEYKFSALQTKIEIFTGKGESSVSTSKHAIPSIFVTVGKSNFISIGSDELINGNKEFLGIMLEGSVEENIIKCSFTISEIKDGVIYRKIIKNIFPR